MTNQASEDELRAEILTEFKQVHKLAPADYTENCTNIVMSIIRTEKLKLLAEIGEPKLEDAINEEKTPEGVKSAPKEPNDIFIILSPYFECKDCGELGCPYNPDVPTELAEAIDQYTQSKLKAFAGDFEALLKNQPMPKRGDVVPDIYVEVLHRIEGANATRGEIRQALKAIKERWIK